MSDENQNPKFSITELREKYPKIGKKWQVEEDEALKKAYEEYRQKGAGNFDALVLELIQQFGRAAGGLKARLAKYFSDVPGWDYGRDQQRAEEMDKKAAATFKPEQDEWLKQEYQGYLENKR